MVGAAMSDHREATETHSNRLLIAVQHAGQAYAKLGEQGIPVMQFVPPDLVAPFKAAGLTLGNSLDELVDAIGEICADQAHQSALVVEMLKIWREAAQL